MRRSTDDKISQPSGWLFSWLNNTARFYNILFNINQTYIADLSCHPDNGPGIAMVKATFHPIMKARTQTPGKRQ
ncbi:hypothetical protein ACFPAG_04025 [Vogesella sp. GCM10023246]|uniref:Uncharacterized protein n=1 Tax=Vogesella oryzagri TaxID=3160864 RepID=A0ABV1M2F1_9NEIS